jgi:hypothetical protein
MLVDALFGLKPIRMLSIFKKNIKKWILGVDRRSNRWKNARCYGNPHVRGQKLKKLMLLAALLAMLIVAAIPAIAQVSQEGEQESDSGDVDQSSEQSQTGDNSISCVNDQLVGNTGNAQTQNQGIQYGSEDGGASPSGNAEITLNPNEDVDEVFTCDAQVNQAASAAS